MNHWIFLVRRGSEELGRWCEFPRSAVRNSKTLPLRRIEDAAVGLPANRDEIIGQAGFYRPPFKARQRLSTTKTDRGNLGHSPGSREPPV